MATQQAGRAFLTAGDAPEATRRLPQVSNECGATAAPCTAAENRTVCDADSPVNEDASAATTQRQTKLNAGAAEFRPSAEVPRSGLSAGAIVSEPVRALSASAQPFYPCGGEPFESSEGGGAYSDMVDDEPASTAEEDEMEVILRTQETLAELSRAPGRYDDLVPALLNDIWPLVKRKQTLKNLADVIVDYAVSSPNVSYTCAQLCSQLDGWSVEEDQFRHCLFRKCRDTTTKLADSRTPKRKHFTVFLAEVFLILGVEEGNETVRCAPLATGVKKLLLGLLAEPDDDDIKGVVQVLKLCGWELTCHERSSREAVKPSVADVQAAVVEHRGRAGVACQRMIDGLLALQASGWGRSHVSTDAAARETDAFSQLPQQPYQNEPIFYSPDGRQITRREAGYAAADEDENQADGELLGSAEPEQFCSGSGDVAADGVYDYDPDMDEEMQAAYEQFCEETSGLHM